MLQSFPRPRPTTNPYLVQLAQGLASAVDVEYFSWRAALWGHYDVLHLHWPEVMLRGNGRARTWGRRAAATLLLARLETSRRTALVRTVHNLKPHEDSSWLEQVLLRWFDRRTTAWIRLNPTTVTPQPQHTTTILLGDYRSWFSSLHVPTPSPGRLLCFGHMRPYKGVEGLMTAFSQMTDQRLSLRLVGSPSNEQMRARIEAACRSDPRVSALLTYADDATLADEIGSASLVVLPYRHMHNSGAALLALSLHRPILVPQNASTDALAHEVGDEWVYTYDGELTAEVLVATRNALAARPPSARPDLSRRDWHIGLDLHLQVYAQARARSSRRGSHPARQPG